MTKSATRAFIPLGIFLALAALLFYGLRLDPREIPSPLIDKPAPDFALQSLQGSEPNPDQGHPDRQGLAGECLGLLVPLLPAGACRADAASQRESEVQMLGFNWKDTRPEALQMLQEFGDPYADHSL